MSNSFSLLLVAVLSYLLGSIPFGLLLTKLAGMGDIRAIGSGNIGATNVLRTGNKKIAALTLFLDAAKGFIAVKMAALLFSGSAAILSLAALMAVLGHMFPVWLRFKGGKGVATGIGVISALHWPTGLITIALWLPLVLWLRISSLATLIVTLFVPLVIVVFGCYDLAPVAVVIVALIFIKHRGNIRRLLNHTEPKIGRSANAPPPFERG